MEGRPLIFFNTKELHRIKCDEIVYAEADGNYSTIYLTNGEEIVLTKQLGTLWEEIASQNPLAQGKFALVGRSIFVNLDFVHFINPSKKVIKLEDLNGHLYELNAPEKALGTLKKYFESLIQKGGEE